MRAVVQPVSRAEVTVDSAVVGTIRDGVLVLVGATHADTPEKAHALARKVYELRILPQGLSAQQAGAPLLVVSQFTLYGDTRKGRRPSWSAAAPAAQAAALIDTMVAALRSLGASVQTGRFQAHMLVESVNVGPVTVLVEV